MDKQLICAYPETYSSEKTTGKGPAKGSLQKQESTKNIWDIE
jgi:hypothetical protein